MAAEGRRKEEALRIERQREEEMQSRMKAAEQKRKAEAEEERLKEEEDARVQADEEQVGLHATESAAQCCPCMLSSRLQIGTMI